MSSINYRSFVNWHIQRQNVTLICIRHTFYILWRMQKLFCAENFNRFLWMNEYEPHHHHLFCNVASLWSSLSFIGLLLYTNDYQSYVMSCANVCTYMTENNRVDDDEEKKDETHVIIQRHEILLCTLSHFFIWVFYNWKFSCLQIHRTYVLCTCTFHNHK